MDSDDFDAARAALVAARRDARLIDPFPPRWLPADLAEAYRLQHAVAKELGAIAGWKVAAITAAQQESLGVGGPIAGPMLAPWIRDAGNGAAQLRLADFIAPLLECEFAFILGADLPTRADRAYTRAEVETAVEAMCLGIEIVDPRLPRGLGVRAELADAFNNGAFIAGPRRRDWRHVAPAAIEITLNATIEGRSSELARGDGGAILDGDPFGALVLLANAGATGARGLRAGDIVTTGSCTGAPRVPGPGTYVAEFAGLGRLALRLI